MLACVDSFYLLGEGGERVPSSCAALSHAYLPKESRGVMHLAYAQGFTE